jgi:hypothetical protein
MRMIGDNDGMHKGAAPRPAPPRTGPRAACRPDLEVF